MTRTAFGLLRTAAVLTIGAILLTGCVQRKLTINTAPADARVFLNDEEIGTSPVTVGFEWYGDFRVRIEKPGYQTLLTHQAIKRPVSDHFPFDLLCDIFGSNRIDSYQFSFELTPYKAPNRAELIKKAEKLRKDTVTELKKPVPE